MLKIKTSGIQSGEALAIVKFRVWLLHAGSLGVFFFPANTEIIIATVLLFFVRVFAWEAGSHRYFSHRSYKTSRIFQFILAVVAASSGQRGPIWWAVHHRTHHKYSDQDRDPHSPVKSGFWYAHIGWVLDQEKLATNLDDAKDLSKYSELVWLNKYHYIFPYISMATTYLIGEYTVVLGATGNGLSALVWVFFLSTMLSLQATFAVNSLTHAQKHNFFNIRQFYTSDTTTNSWILCIPTMGASWHNNHHRYKNAARAGFYWWELDLSYIALKTLSWLGIVWDLNSVPNEILDEGRLRIIDQKNGN